MSQEKYKLMYFNVRGRAEVVRLLFYALNLPFEDNRIQSADWPELKPTIPTHRLPYLEVTSSGGSKRFYEETMAIARYLAYKYEMLADNQTQEYLIERIMGQCAELDEYFFKIMFAPSEEEGKKLRVAYKNENAPTLIEFITNSLSQSGGKFAAGSKLTLADLYLLTVMDHVNDLDKEILKKFPAIEKHRKDVLLALPILADYLKRRPVTDR